MRFGIGFVCLLLQFPALANAAVEDVSAIEWVAPKECAQEERLVSDIESLLGRKLTEQDKNRGFRAEIDRDEIGYRLRITSKSDSSLSERLVRSASCDELIKAAAVILALALDPNVVLPPEVLLPPRALPEKPISKDSSSARSLQWMLSVLGGVEYGALPEMTPAFRLKAGVAIDAWQVEAAGTYLLSQHQVLAALDAGADVDLAAVSLYGGHRWRLGSVDWVGSLGLEVGSMRASATDVTSPSSGNALWVAPLVSSCFEWKLGKSVFFQLDTEGVWALNRPPFVIVNLGEVYQAPSISGRALLGGGVIFE